MRSTVMWVLAPSRIASDLLILPSIYTVTVLEITVNWI